MPQEKVIFELQPNCDGSLLATGSSPFPIQLTKQGKDKYTVIYGKQVTKDLNHTQASHELGECIMHALQCDGKLD